MVGAPLFLQPICLTIATNILFLYNFSSPSFCVQPSQQSTRKIFSLLQIFCQSSWIKGPGSSWWSPIIQLTCRRWRRSTTESVYLSLDAPDQALEHWCLSCCAARIFLDNTQGHYPITLSVCMLLRLAFVNRSSGIAPRLFFFYLEPVTIS